MRLVLWILASPIRLVAWVFRIIAVRVRGYSVLRLRLHGHLPDRSGPLSLARMWATETQGPALLEVLLALDRARADARLRAVALELGPLRIGLARAEEVRRALARVRDAGKQVVVHLEQGGLAEYSIALGASEIVMPDSGSLHVAGLASEVVLLKGLFDKVGLRAGLRARGRYKAARETFTEPEMTPEHREMTTAMVGDLYAQVVQAIAENRRIPEAVVRERLDRGPFTAKLALELGLIDAIGQDDDVNERLEASLGKVRSVGLGGYFRLSEPALPPRVRATIGLLEVSGHIKSGATVPGQSGARATGSRRFVQEVRELADDPRVAAVVLRVSSPGGSALASDVMWHALMALREKKPVVVSMVDVAASGGYFVSGIEGAPIFASEATITGSIGVLAGKFDAAGLYEKLGIKKEIIGAGARAGFYSEARPFTPDEVQKLEEDLDAHYGQFLERMARGRGRTTDEIHAVGEGRVFTGRMAKGHGLVDEHGGFLDALARAKSLIGLAPRDRVAIVATASERRFFPLRLTLRVPESFLPESIVTPLRLAEWFVGERTFVIVPFDFRIF